MIHSEPPITGGTINTPKARARARALLVLSGAGGQVEDEDQMHAHLRHRQGHQRGGNGWPIDQSAEAEVEGRRRQANASWISLTGTSP